MVSGMKIKIAALVLAAGESRRLASPNKLLLPFGGTTVVECAVDAILCANVDEVIVVLGYEAEAVRQALGQRPLRFVYNPDYRCGMASSIQAGIATVTPEVGGVMISLADLPLIEPAELNLLIMAFLETKKAAELPLKTRDREPHGAIVVPTFSGQRGNPVIFDLCYRHEMIRLRGDVGGKSILARHPEAVLEVEMPTASVLEDIDTMEEYNRLVAKVRNQQKSR
ncbi:MAG: nucleotidyltransferase family protein [candidate division KSB1 bacterium]|nr:nucleotidyltransferase family protein [candidate division KSB1 bacterium]MDZ7302396.1 nucleotidyltransferase family protein [candidate division KSB1 bacterium]MDZ7311599.1 nucleotidyltransferase family protein [candidate division KSB1 bacterium]